MRSLIGFVVSMLVAGSMAWAGKAPAESPALKEKGVKAYKTNCAMCHGEKGDGKGPVGASLNPKARDFTTGDYKFGGTPDSVFKIISEGSKGTSMAAFGHLPEEDRWGLTYYVLSLKAKK